MIFFQIILYDLHQAHSRHIPFTDMERGDFQLYFGRSTVAVRPLPAEFCSLKPE